MPGKIRILPLAAIAVMLTACNLSLFPDALPTLSNINGAALPAGAVGSAVVLAGAGFGDAQGSGRVLFSPATGGAALIATTTLWTQAAVVATVPSGAPGDYVVAVQSGNGITSGARLFTVTPAAPFNASAVTWSAGPTLPGAVSGAGVAYAQIGTGGYLYVVGGAGAGGAPVADVSYTTVGTNGTLGGWTATTPLPTALAFPGAVAATQRNSAVISNGFVYALGGATNAGGAPVATVYRAPINADGSLGSWTTATVLPAALRSVGAIIMYGSLYVIGGAAASNAPSTAAYRSPIQVDGAVTWKTQMALPSGRARFGFGGLGLFLYVVGGDGDAVAPNDTNPSTGRSSTVYFAKLNPSTRDIATSWTATTPLPAARSAHTAVFGTSSVLVTGGLYAGALTNTDEEVSAPVNADGTIGTFATASPATSISSLCGGCSLFNHGATGYMGSNGGFHVLVAGGDDAKALGTRRAGTFIY